ncbi:MAG: FG-GAP-like repeat-containing protein [Terriglobales bacterium]
MPKITALSPSSVMVNVPLGILTVTGSNFHSDALIEIDGQLVSTDIIDPNTLEAEVPINLDYTPATHQIVVQQSTGTSQSVSFTVYAPQQGPFVMNAIPGFLVSEGETGAPFILAADVTGDGLADVIMPGAGLLNPAGLTILAGQSNGSLSAPQYLAMPTTPYAVAVDDVDGNGTPDLVFMTSDNSTTTTVSIMLGDGHGNFQPPSVQQTFSGVYPGPAYLSDLDGDGKLDLVLAVEQPSGAAYNLVWLQNTGGAFGAPTTLATATNSNFSIADFNGDGKPDIIYKATSQSLHILMNQGRGSFTDQAASGLNGIVGQVSVMDFNLDGLADLILQVQQGASGVLYSFQGKGDGSFKQVASLSTPGPINVVAGDFDHDGFPDLAGPSGSEPSQILYFFGDGTGNFVIQPVVGPAGQFIAVGDFNGDGIPDVVVPDRFSFVSLALGRKDRSFPSGLSLTPPQPAQSSAGDINGDGLQEIFFAGGLNISGGVFQNEGNDLFQLAAATDPSSLLLADLTGKGVVDLIGNCDTGLVIWPNNGTFNFSSSPITLPAINGPITVADIDGDGHPDIVGSGQIFFGNGAYGFTPVSIPPTFDGPYVIGDFNGDGKLDIALGGQTLLNAGNRTFTSVNTSSLPLVNGALVAVADFNKDGKDDVAINIPGEENIGIYYSQGDGTFYLATEVDAGGYPGGLVAGDFNGDGRADVAAGLMLAQQGVIFFNNSNGQFSRSFFASGADTVAMTAADLNHRGVMDLVFSNFEYVFAPPNADVIFHK